MADLRKLCTRAGWQQVATYIQSGNVVFESPGNASMLEDTLEGEIRVRFGFEASVLIRSAEQWGRICQANPFPQASEAEPSRVALALPKNPIPGSVAAEIGSAAVNSERVEQAGGALWIHFPEGSGHSKITPALLDRLAGSPVTTRNWRTVNRLREMTSR